MTEQRLTTPELEPFIVLNVRPTGRELGAGAYGSVVEIEIAGALVAAKKLHDGLVQFGSEEQVRKWISDFVDECKLMSLLRHPHIVQFLGVCYLTESRLPILLMEKLDTNLDSLLETNENIPLDVKCSILIDVSRGLVCLHSHDPSIAHRDLTARNILLDSGLTAKIADLGVARIVNLGPGQIAATMTRAPGNIIYMPPEAVEEVGAARYNTAIDMFSFGNVALFTLTQVFMKNLKPSTYLDPTTQRIEGRSEIERRVDYIQLMFAKLGETHPLVKLTLDCLEYDPQRRPTAVEVLERLERSVDAVPQNWNISKLELIRRTEVAQGQIEGVQMEKEQLRGQLAEKENEIEVVRSHCERQQIEVGEKQGQIDLLQADVTAKQDQVHRLEQLTTLQQQQLQALRVEIATQHVEIEAKNTEITALHAAQLSGRLRSLEVPITNTRETRTPSSIVFDWRRCKDYPQGIGLHDMPVVLNGKVYVKGAGGKTIYVYTPVLDEWNELPPPPVKQFTMALVNDQLVLVGGIDRSYKTSNKIVVWNSQSRQWVQPYPPMAISRKHSAAVGYREYLIVAGGNNSGRTKVPDVNILDTTSSTWLTVESLPTTDYYNPVLVEDVLYLLGSETRSFLRANIPTLISATLAIPTSASPSAWESLPPIPFYMSSPVAIDNLLMTVGGRTSDIVSNLKPTTSIQLYNNEWTKVGELPEALFSCLCTVTSRELLVLGGQKGYANSSRSVYSAVLTVQ